MSAALAWTILLPLAGALLALLAPRAGRWLLAASALATLGAVAFVIEGVARGATGHVIGHDIGGFGAPLGIRLRGDGLAAVMLGATAVVWSLVTVTVLQQEQRVIGRGRLLPLWLFAWAAMNALTLSADAFNLYVALELVTLAAVGLIALDGGHDALRAALRYLLFALPGSLFYLLGTALLYSQHAALDFALLQTSLQRMSASDDAISSVALLLIAVGLSLKGALFPLHGWLPPAYVAARPTVSAVLSALISKAPFYVLLRVWLEMMPEGHDLEAAGTVLAALGAAGVVWASLVALRQQRLRALIAYSSVAQLGYLFVFFGLASHGPTAAHAAWQGVIYLAISHAAAVAALFLATAAISQSIGHDDVSSLGGLAHELPVTFFTFAIAGVSLMGMPPSGGFIAKWLLVRAAVDAGQWWLAAAILVGGLLAAGYVFRVLRNAFLPASAATHFVRLAPGTQLVALALALVSLLLGLIPSAVLSLVGAGP